MANTKLDLSMKSAIKLGIGIALGTLVVQVALSLVMFAVNVVLAVFSTINV